MTVIRNHTIIADIRLLYGFYMTALLIKVHGLFGWTVDGAAPGHVEVHFALAAHWEGGIREYEKHWIRRLES